MTYLSDTLTSANPSADLYAALDTALTANGYTLVDTVTISTRIHKIYQNPAANNITGQDWYLDVTYTATGNANLFINLFESYDTSTEKALGGPYGAYTQLTTNVSFGTSPYRVWGGSAQGLESNWMPNPVHAYSAWNKLVLNDATFGYWISVTKDRVIGMTTLEPNYTLYVGAYDPLPGHIAAAGTDLFPLVVTRLNGGSGPNSGGHNTGTAITRLPKASSALVNVQGSGVVQTFRAAAYTAPPLPTGASDFDIERTVWPSGIGMAVTTWGQGCLGMLYDILSASSDGGLTRGDTATIGGANYVISATGTMFKQA